MKYPKIVYKQSQNTIVLKKVDIEGNVCGEFVEFTINHSYENIGKGDVEAVYNFPIPDTAILSGFEATIGGRSIKGKVEEKKEIEEKTKEYQDLISYLNESLKNKVSEVKLSSRLKDSAVCLVSKEGISLEMEKVLASMPGGNNMMKAQKVLEINPNHILFKTLEKLYLEDKESIEDYADLLYSQALLVEGFKLDDPIEFSNKMCNLMIKSVK